MQGIGIACSLHFVTLSFQLPLFSARHILSPHICIISKYHQKHIDMKNLKLSIIILLVGLTTLPLMAQNKKGFTREIGFSIGTRFSAINEARYSALTKKYIQPKFGFHFNKWNDKTRKSFSVSYSTTQNVAAAKNLWYKVFHPEINYSYQRKVGTTWIGAFYESNTLLLFPKSNTSSFGNNPISYTMANNIGLTVDYSRDIATRGNARFDADLGARVALLSYLVRPIHGHPYPEKFMQEGVFDPNMKGLGKAMIKSGKIRTIDKYNSIKLSFGLNYYHKDHLKVGLRFERNIQKVSEGRRMSFGANDLMMRVSYVY